MLNVTWKTLPQTDGLAYITTLGKWGSENTPEVVIANIKKEIAEHIVNCHNSYISNKEASRNGIA